MDNMLRDSKHLSLSWVLLLHSQAAITWGKAVVLNPKETANSLQKASALGTDFFFSIESHQFFPNDIMPEYSQMQESLIIKAIFRKLSCCRRPLSHHYASATTSYESANKLA